MRQLFKPLTLSVWLLVCAGSAVHADAQSVRYPPADERWDGTTYRALVERVETKGLALPTLSNSATKPVFERMVKLDNIPLHMGLNRKLSVTIRWQRLDDALDPIHDLVILYSKEMKKGKPYATELAELMVYETQINAALLDLGEPYLSTLREDKRYKVHVDYLDKVRRDARQIYSGLVQGMTETRLYPKPEILKMIEVALDGLSSYQPIFTQQDRSKHVQRLTQQISKTTDQELKAALTQLRDAIKNREIRT